jgi:AAA family ATP:ADP antiporter
MLLAIYFSSKVERQELSLKGNTSTYSQVFEQFTQIKENPLIRNFIFYAFIWTCLSTALWFFQLEIINNFTNDSAVKTQIFGRADSMVPIITLVTQLLLTSYFLRSKYLGIRFVLTMYGVLFTAAFLAVSGYFSEYLLSASGITLFLILQGTMRPFEYGLNKPAREAVFTTLSTKEKYKSTVFIDTFTNRFGDATGGLLFNSLLSFGLLLYAAPLAIIPLAIFLINLGWSISKDIDPVNSK